MTRRCSVMRMPVAAQRASMPVALGTEDFNAVMIAALEDERGMFATIGILRQVSPHQKRVQLFPAALLVITLAAANDAESGLFVKPSRRHVVFFHFQKDAAHAKSREMTEMGQQQIFRKTFAAISGIDRDRQYLGFVRAHPRYGQADDPSPEPQSMHQR